MQTADRVRSSSNSGDGQLGRPATAAYNHDALERLRGSLDVVRPQPGGFLARCPVPNHGRGQGDRRPSLSVRLGRNGVPVLRCHGGCETRDVLAAIGLTFRDLYR